MLDGGDALAGQEGEGEGELCQASRDHLDHSSAGHRGHLNSLKSQMTASIFQQKKIFLIEV